MSKRDEFKALMEMNKEAVPNITNEAHKGYLNLARTAYGLTTQEAEKILKDVGITVGPSINYFEVLKLNVDEIRSLSDSAAEKRIQKAYDERFAEVRRMPNGNPRKAEILNLLAQAKVFLIDKGKWQQHLQEIVGGDRDDDNGNDEIEFPSGERASTPEELSKLIDKHWDEAKFLLYSGSIALWLESLGERNLTIATKEITNRYRSERDIGLEEFVQRLAPQIGKPKLQVNPAQIDFGRMDTESEKTIDIQIRNAGRGYLYGDIRLSSSIPGLELSATEIRSESVVSVKLDASQPTPDKTHQTFLVFNTNGGMIRLPVSCSVIPKVTSGREMIPDVNTKDEDGNTPLHLAAREGDHKRVEALLKNGADIHAKGKYGDTPLHEAAWSNASETVKILLKNGADIHAKDKYGKTPLHEAAQGNASDTAEILLKNGADVNAKDKFGETPLHEAARSQASDTAEILLKNGADVNAKDEDGETPLHNALHTAALSQASDTAEILLKNGADVNAKDEDGKTPLELAVSYDAPETEAVLRKYNETVPDVNTKDADGRTLLHRAAANNDYERVETLVKQGSDVNVKDHSGNTPLHFAAFKNASETVEILLRNGADIGATNHDDLDILSIILLKDADKVLEVLLKLGIEVIKQDESLLLHSAARVNAYKIAEVLLKHGSNVNVKDKNGKTALHIAEENNMDNMVALLRKYGARKGWFR